MQIDPRCNIDPELALATAAARIDQDEEFWLVGGRFKALDRLPPNVASVTSGRILLDDTNVSDLSALAGMAHIRDLFVGPMVQDISVVRTLPSLEWFISRGQPDGTTLLRDLSPLSACPSLKRLEIDVSATRDLTFLEGLRNLKYLEIHNFGGQPIRFPVGLETLKFHGARRDSFYGLKLPPLREIRHLAIPALTESTLSSAPYPRLEALSLAHAEIQSLAGLEGLPSLRSLAVASSAVGSLTGIDALERLETLVLDNACLADIVPASTHPVLKSARFRRSPVASLAGWNKNTLVRSLDLSNCRVEDISPLFPGTFVFLNFAGNPIRSIAGIEAVQGLRTLNISQTRVEDIRPVAAIADFLTARWFPDTPGDTGCPLFEFQGCPVSAKGTRLGKLLAEFGGHRNDRKLLDALCLEFGLAVE